MNQLKLITNSGEETENLGYRLGKHLFSGAVLTLEGDLGAGKTTFTKGIAKSLHINQIVKSPTFTIIKEYNGDLPLYHMDVYRLDDMYEDLGFDDYFYSDGVTVVEWAKRIKEQLPKNYLEINVFNLSETKREVVLIPHGEQYVKLCEVLHDE
ncbi:tRNA (adenosine(37)-N6)-threonylcarbamoyltransferase complex ATPase subunit type 1 TsaE [Haloplasma contractile]|nr:tRNA (adenosine(37)-N6)-threonylcarbamoyltransferase complex ATPase subunit type 1 TsaE [Haloplasma contractile]